MSSFYGCGGYGGSGSGKDGVGISSAIINEQGELVFTLTNNTTQNVGKVVGANGATFTPHIENGMLYWTNDSGLVNPEPISLAEIDTTTWTEIQEVMNEM